MWLTLVAMTLASSMILVDQTAVPLASPDVVQGLGGNIDEGQWILTANILPLAAFMVLGGRLGDLFGLRRVFLTGAVLFALADDADGGRDHQRHLAQGASRLYAWHPRRRVVVLRRLGPVLGGVLTSVSWRLCS